MTNRTADDARFRPMPGDTTTVAGPHGQLSVCRVVNVSETDGTVHIHADLADYDDVWPLDFWSDVDRDFGGAVSWAPARTATQLPDPTKFFGTYRVGEHGCTWYAIAQGEAPHTLRALGYGNSGAHDGDASCAWWCRGALFRDERVAREFARALRNGGAPDAGQTIYIEDPEIADWIVTTLRASGTGDGDAGQVWTAERVEGGVRWGHPAAVVEWAPGA